MVDEISPPNSCGQSEGWTVLFVRNVTLLDLGRYSCSLLRSNVTLGKAEALLTGMQRSFRGACKVIQIPECGKFLLLESRIQEFTSEIRGPGVWNQEYRNRLEYAIQVALIKNAESRYWIP